MVNISRGTLSRKQVVRLRKLISYLTASSSHNKFYKNKLKRVGIFSGKDIRHNPEFYKIPFTTKREFLEDQKSSPLLGTNCTLLPQDYPLVMSTSGTTQSQPLFVPFSQHDFVFHPGSDSGWMKTLGITNSDHIAFILPSALSLYWKVEVERQNGASILIIDQYASDQILTRLKSFGATTLVTFPTQMLQLLYDAQENFISLRKLLSVKTLIAMGESGASNPYFRKTIERGWGANLYDLAGSTENNVIAVECPEHKGLHINENDFIYEILDPITSKPVRRGELVLTNLRKYDFPFIRYRTEDLVEVENGICSCGNPSPRLIGGILGRIDKRIRIADLFFHEYELEEAIRCTENVIMFQLILLPMFGAEIKAVFTKKTRAKDIDKIRQTFYNKTGIKPKIISVKPTDLSKDERKFRKVVDKRLKETNPLSSRVKYYLSKVRDLSRNTLTS